MTHPVSPNYEFSIEVTTYCNMRCSFCSNQELIASSVRPLKHLTLPQLDRILDFIEKFPTPKDKTVTINPTGLGEPFANPLFIDILHAIRARGLNLAGFHTNGTMLTNDVIEQVLMLHLSWVCVSLRFPNRERYMKECEDDYYDHVEQNIMAFLAYDRPRTESLHIQIFGNEDYSQAEATFKPFMKPQDRVYIVERRDLIGFLHESALTHRHSCIDPFVTLVIDLDGNVYPCCQALWTGNNKALLLGNVAEGVEVVYDRLLKVQAEGVANRKPCIYCPT